MDSEAKGMSRRTFLKGFGAAVAVGVASTAVPAGIASAETVVDKKGDATVGYTKLKTGYPTQNPEWLGQPPEIPESTPSSLPSRLPAV